MEHNSNSPLPLGSRSQFSPRFRQKSTRSPIVPSSHKKSSRFSVSGKSVQTTQIVIKTAFHNAEKYGNTLPVIITEAITFADRNTVVSVRVSDCGYAWLVCGRRLLVWQFKQSVNSGGTPQRRTQGGQCFELTLPQSDLAHRAELVSVFLGCGSHTPACIAVSPEGVIRYWPNVSHEGVSVEQIVDLQGQECDSLCALGGKVEGCVLATTTCTVVLVQPRLSPGGRHTLYCHTLRTPTGWLGGIGKRMSSLIFGPMTAEHSGETRLVRVLSVKQTDEIWHVYVLAGHSLQKWLMSSSESEQLVSVSELGRVFRDAYQCTAWESSGSDPTDIDIWLLDVQVVNGSIMILAAAVNLHVSPQVQYALVRMDAESLQQTSQVEEFLLLKLFGLYQEDGMADFLSYRLLICDANVFVHRQKDVTIVQQSTEPDVLDFAAIGDKLLGGSVCCNTPIFFSRNHGLIAIYPVDHTMQDLNRSVLDVSVSDKSILFNETLSNQTSHLTLYNLEPEDLINAQKDTLGQVKAAFLFHIKGQQQSCLEIIQELFPEEGETKNEIDNSLDKVVISISEELLDDVPVGDPRWFTETGGLGSSSAMQIQHQLEDKQQALRLYLQFLQNTGLWSRLSAISVKNSILSTLHVLADHSELIVAAIKLQSLTATNTQMLQDAIDYVVDELYDEPKAGLTRQDIFYREISKIHCVFWALVEKCTLATTTDIDPMQLTTIILETNNIILAVLATIMAYRQMKASFFSPSLSVTQIPVEYIPWTMSAGDQGLFDSLQKQQALTLRYGARVFTEGAVRANLYDQYVSLVDIMLDARKCHVDSVRGTNIQPTQRGDLLLRQYQQERQKLIQPLIDDKEWERATLLAEKYLDFTTLVTICENTNNQTRLDEYLDRFKDEEFAQHVFNWYLREGKQGKLLARCKAASRTALKPTSSSSLTKFLGAHPKLKWLQHAFQGDYVNTAQTLKSLANDEKDLLTRKKSMLSFAKLSHFVAHRVGIENEFVQDINNELELIQCQEELPDEILTEFGYDTTAQPVLDPITLAQLSVCPENQDATEYDFKRALELTNHVPDLEKRNELTLFIWSCAILRDNLWKSPLGGLESPVEVLRHTMFYKLTDLSINLGTRPEEVLPPLEILLTAPKLENLITDTNFQYLIKVGYEHFCRGQDFGESYRI